MTYASSITLFLDKVKKKRPYFLLALSCGYDTILLVIKGFKLPQDLLEAYADIFDKMTARSFNLGFIDIKKYPISGHGGGIENQIILLYMNGRYEVLPSYITGLDAELYLGYRLSRVTHWGVLPCKKSKYDIRKIRQKSQDIVGPEEADKEDLYPSEGED